MHTNPTTPMSRPAKRLSVFAFYTDFTAGVNAKLVADGLAGLFGEHDLPWLDIWKLDSIPSVGPLKDTILQEARKADVLIFACSSPCEREAPILQWMNCLTALDPSGHRPALLVGLFDEPKTRTQNFEWFLDLFALFAQRAGHHFVWREMNRDAVRNAHWLREPLAQAFGKTDSMLHPAHVRSENDLALA